MVMMDAQGRARGVGSGVVGPRRQTTVIGRAMVICAFFLFVIVWALASWSFYIGTTVNEVKSSSGSSVSYENYRRWLHIPNQFYRLLRVCKLGVDLCQ